MTYKESVKKLRLKMLMTQKEFAKLLDFSFATINKLIFIITQVIPKLKTGSTNIALSIKPV